jgi:hypothetical protein
LKTWTCAVNCEGPSAWISAPTPETEVPRLSVRGPFPLLPRSDVQIRESPALKPTAFQLHNAAGHSIASKLFGPAKVIVMPSPLSDVAVKLPPSTVASAPSCDQWIASFAFWAARVVTGSIESARQIVAAKRLAISKPKSAAGAECRSPRAVRGAQG